MCSPSSYFLGQDIARNPSSEYNIFASFYERKQHLNKTNTL